MELQDLGIVTEMVGGDIQCAMISAKDNVGVDELLEMILLQVSACLHIILSTTFYC